MQHGTDTAEKPGIYELSCPFPLEVLVILLIVPVQLQQVLSQLPGALELVHMYEGVVRSNCLVITRSGTHHYGQY